MKVAIIGGGVGGLAAAARLAIHGHRVQIFEARNDVGGLASGFQAGGVWFDGGPYIVLDRPGLEWAFEKVGLDVAGLRLNRAEDFYKVGSVHVYLDLQRTAEGLGAAGPAYTKFVTEMNAIRVRLEPLLRVSHPNLIELARRGSLGLAPFLLRSLGSVLARSGLPPEIVDAVAIWTHIAGQSIDEAPSVMAFVPALIHCVGAFVPEEGMRSIPQALAENARRHGVEIHCGRAIQKIVTKNGRVVAVDDNACDAVISDYNGIGTYDELVDVPARVKEKLRAMPLQSPGLCAYLTATVTTPGPYLRFKLDHGLRLRVSHGRAVRMIMPFDRQATEEQQAAELQRMLDDPWWREGLSDVQLVHSRTVRGWGREMKLYRDSMNPAMTRRLMLRGRLAHRSPWVKGLYLAGASTHPGQWVSFCAISGVLAADLLHADHAAGSI
jgi:phytoene dehydrogenase-like protein